MSIAKSVIKLIRTAAPLVGLLFYLVPTFVYGQTPPSTVDTNIFGSGEIAAQNRYGSDAASILTSLATNGLRIFLFIITAMAIIGIINSGLKYIKAGNNNDKATEAKNALLFAIVGIIVVSALYFIIGASSGYLANLIIGQASF